MVVKVSSKDGNFQRLDECFTACFAPDNIEPDTLDKKGTILNRMLVCTYSNGKDNTYPLEEGDTIYFMNNDGKTIDKICI
jgi:hypothetical protein